MQNKLRTSINSFPALFFYQGMNQSLILMFRTMLFVLLITTSIKASATHIRAGSLTYELGASTSTTQDVNFIWNLSMRASFFTSPLSPLPVGSTIGSPVINPGSFSFGNGSANFTSPSFIIREYDSALDRLIADAQFTYTYNKSDTPYTAEWNTCCRSTFLQDGNQDSPIRYGIDVQTGTGAVSAPNIFDDQLEYALLIGTPSYIDIGTSSGMLFMQTPIADSGLFSSPTFLSVTNDGRIVYDGSELNIHGIYALQVQAQDPVSGLYAIKEITLDMTNDCNNNLIGCYVPPSAVPVPAAVWLFGSALIGLVGFRRQNLS
jgi:hypothetical protein